MNQSNGLATIANDDQIEAQAKTVADRMLPLFPNDLKSPHMALAVARVAVAYGLDPFLGELIPYQGKPYLTLDGRIRIADRHPAYDGYDIEPATDAERKALGAGEGQSVWKCSVYRKDRKRPTVSYGRAGGQGEQNPVAKQWTAEVAQKRAIHRALRAAFPAPIPGLEESLSPEQLRAIHAYDNDAGVSPDERRGTLVDTFGVEHSNELTKDQASAYIDARVIDVDEDGVIADDVLTPEQLERDMAYVRQLAADAMNASDLKRAYSSAVGIFGDDPEVAGIFTARKQELVAARIVAGGINK